MPDTAATEQEWIWPMRFTLLSHGAAETEIIAALHSRDLSHKGSQKRQDDYVRRTIQKAATLVRGESLCR